MIWEKYDLIENFKASFDHSKSLRLRNEFLGGVRAERGNLSPLRIPLRIVKVKKQKRKARVKKKNSQPRRKLGEKIRKH